MATTSNLFIDQGSDFSVVVNLRNQDGTVLILTGYTLRGQFRKSYGSLAFTEFTIAIVDENQGKISIFLSGSDSSLLKAGRYVYDVETTHNGTPKRLLEGIVTISPESTKENVSPGSNGLYLPQLLPDPKNLADGKTIAVQNHTWIVDSLIPGPQGIQGIPGVTGQAAGIVVLSDDELSVTAFVGSYALLSDGTDPYPHIVVRTEFA